MLLVNYTKEQINSFYSKSICCYGETVQKLVIALQNGCHTASDLRNKAKRLYLIMYALDSIEMDDNGMTENNALDPDGLAKIVAYIQANCTNC